MFSKAKRFEPAALLKTATKDLKTLENVKKTCNKILPPPPTATKPKTTSLATPSKSLILVKSQCSSTHSVKSFATPKPIKSLCNKASSNLKKPLPLTKAGFNKKEKNVTDDILKEHEVEIRNKDFTIQEYSQQIEELKYEISNLQKQLNTKTEYSGTDGQKADTKVEASTNEGTEKAGPNQNDLKDQLCFLEKKCESLEQEISIKQVDLSSLEELITIRDSLCKDLQDKLTDTEKTLEEAQQRLEMVKGHHALALEANESIRREYKAELETLKVKLDEEKQTISAKSKLDQESIKTKYMTMIQALKTQLIKEKEEIVQDLEHQIMTKELEMKAKLEQIDEATHEKLRICEIQFEERTQNIQDHMAQQQERILFLEKEVKDLQYHVNITEDQNKLLQKELTSINKENDTLRSEKFKLLNEIDELKEGSKKRTINFENDINKLTFKVDNAMKERNKFELSLSVTRDIVQVLTVRLRESDNELESMETEMLKLTNLNKNLDNELSTCKNTLNNCMLECNEYKDALVNILKSKAALAKEHTRIMEHNVTLIESLQNVEKEAYRELGSIKNELIEDVEFIKQESNSQIQMLRDEVEKKQMLCEMAAEHAGVATEAAEQSRALLSHAAAEITRLEQDNQHLQKQIQDEQSLVVEVSLLRQENEELTMTVAKQSSIIEKMKKDMEICQVQPKSPSVLRKNHKLGKENLLVISPLRERNH